jgi:hypothetical protein
MVRSTVEGLTGRLASDRQRALSLLNVGGGPAADSINALIVIRSTLPQLLTSRRIDVAVLDIDAGGPAFGARAVEALRKADQPLEGVQLSFSSVHYDWSDRSRLLDVLQTVTDRNAITAVSSEGGLFEYGDDEIVVTNLQAVHSVTPSDAIVVGSVTRAGHLHDRLQDATRRPLYPRSIEGFTRLATCSGWSVDHVIERPFCYIVRMHKAADTQ